MRPRRSIWLGAVATIGLLGTWSAFGLHRSADVEIETEPVTTGPIVRRLVATGTLQAIATVQVGAQISGTVQALYVDYNSIVHQGQVLARLDPAQFDAALDEARASLGQARASLLQTQANRMGLETAISDAQNKLRRAEDLAARQVIPPSDLDAARIAVDVANADLRAGESTVTAAQAAVDVATAVVSQADVDLAHTAIASPIDGIVVARNVEVGQTVASALQAPVLFTIASDFTRMQVEVDVDESDIGGVRLGEAATFDVESYPNEQFAGTVSQVRLQPLAEETATATTVGLPAPTTTAVPAVISYATMIAVVNPGEKLRPGMTATVRLDGSRVERSVRIPNRALSFRPPPDVLNAIKQAEAGPTASGGGVRRVWQYDGVQFMPIEINVGLSDDRWTELTGGPLADGAPLVTAASLGRGAGRVGY